MSLLLYLTNSRLPTEKAHGYQIMKMCEAFASHGMEVRLLHPWRILPEECKADPFTYYDIPGRFVIETIKSFDGIAFSQNKGPAIEELSFKLQSILFSIKMIYVLKKYWKREDVIYYSRDLVTTLVLLNFRKLIKGKIVFEAHTFPNTNIERINKKFRKLDVLVTITEQIRKRFVEKGLDQSKIFVAHDGVDLDKFDVEISKSDARKKLGIPGEIKIAAYVGKFHTMDMEKGIPDIIQASKYLVSKIPDLFFYFVGGPLDRVEKYEQIIENEKLPRNRFIFFDKQDIKLVPYFLKASDVLLMPHPWNEFYAYNVSPLKMFEYMASRRPIVASAIPTVMEVLKNNENAFLGEAGNSLDIAENISKALLDGEMAQKVSEQAYVDVLRHTWSSRAKEILEKITS